MTIDAFADRLAVGQGQQIRPKEEAVEARKEEGLLRRRKKREEDEVVEEEVLRGLKYLIQALVQMPS